MKNLVLVFEHYDSRAIRWETFLRNLHLPYQLLVLESREHHREFLTPFSYYLQLPREHRGLHYSKLRTPSYWDMRLTPDARGELLDKGKKRAEISFYHPKSERMVESVSWLDQKGRVLTEDRYDSFGNRYCQLYYDIQGNPTVMEYFDETGKSAITEIFYSQIIFLNREGNSRSFSNYRELKRNFLQDYLGEDSCLLLGDVEILDYLPNDCQSHFILPQRLEEVDLSLLQQYDTKLRSYLVDEGVFQDFLPEFFAPQKLREFAYFEPVPVRSFTHDVVIVTNSQEIEHIEELVVALPNYQFTILAPTIMGGRLLALDTYEHVHLCANASPELIHQHLSTSSIFLDINHYNEVYNSVEVAYANNLLILGFEQTLHNRQYIHSSCVFDSERYSEMIDLLQQLQDNPRLFDELLLQQIACAQKDKDTCLQLLMEALA